MGFETGSVFTEGILDMGREERESSRSPSEKAGERGVTDALRLLDLDRAFVWECLCVSLLGLTRE